MPPPLVIATSAPTAARIASAIRLPKLVSPLRTEERRVSNITLVLPTATSSSTSSLALSLSTIALISGSGATPAVESRRQAGITWSFFLPRLSTHSTESSTTPR